MRKKERRKNGTVETDTHTDKQILKMNNSIVGFKSRWTNMMHDARLNFQQPNQ